jgi:hypothetical protein
VRRADKCQLSRNLGASTSWNPKDLSRPVMGLLYLFTNLRDRQCTCTSDRCCSGNAAMNYVCIVKLQVTVKNEHNKIKIGRVAQQCFYGDLISSATIKHT